MISADDARKIAKTEGERVVDAQVQSWIDTARHLVAQRWPSCIGGWSVVTDKVFLHIAGIPEGPDKDHRVQRCTQCRLVLETSHTSNWLPIGEKVVELRHDDGTFVVFAQKDTECKQTTHLIGCDLRSHLKRLGQDAEGWSS